MPLLESPEDKVLNHWSPDGRSLLYVEPNKELNYIAPDGTLMAAAIKMKGAALEPGTGGQVETPGMRAPAKIPPPALFCLTSQDVHKLRLFRSGEGRRRARRVVHELLSTAVPAPALYERSQSSRQLSEHTTLRRGSTMDHRVRAIIDIVERDLKHPVDWQAVGHLVRLSPSGLRRLFTLSTGLSPSAYVTRLRFERARELLSTPDTALLRVKEIMAEVGIDDPSHFAREFKKRYGETPKSFPRRSLDSPRAGDSAN